MTLWVPHGVDLGEDASPSADSRMINFVGLNGGGHRGFHMLKQRAEAWPTTEATSEGVASLLSTARDLFAYGYYAYAFLAVAGTWSIAAVEAGLRLRLNAERKNQLSALVRQAEKQGLLPATGWDYQRLDAGRQLGNRTLHGDQQQLWTPAMAESIVKASHEMVAALFPVQGNV